MTSEFQDFQDGEEVRPPHQLSNRILSQVHRDLNPSAVSVFSKLLLIHLGVAVFTLSICPQLGFRLLGEGMGLMHYFMSLGHYGCMMACGSFFLSTSMIAAAVILKPEELKALRKARWLELGSLVLLSFMIFFAINPEIALGIAISWLFGAFLSAIFILEVGWRLRVRLLANRAHA